MAAALADAGANKARTEHGHANAMRLELGREPLRHADHRELARHVRAEAEPAIHPGHRGGVDEVAAFAVLADMREEGPDAVENPGKIDVEHPSPIVERDIVDAAGRGDTGIVAHHMDLSERVMRRFRPALDAWGIGNVTNDPAYIRADIVQASDGGRERVGLYICEQRLHARFRKGPAEREPDAAGPARHECCLAGELAHVCPC